MSKEKFLQELEAALTNQLSGEAIQAQLNYYKAYINEQIASGRDEAEVMTSLGDPYLIANTIIQGQEFEQPKVTEGYSRDRRIEPEYRLPFYKNPIFWVLITILVIVIAVLALVTKLLALFWPVVLLGIIISVVYRYINKQR